YGIAKTSVLERILHCKTQSRPRRVTAVVGTGCTIRSTRGSRRHNRSSVTPTKVLHEGVTGSRHELDFHARNHSSGPAGGTAQRAPGAPARQPPAATAPFHPPAGGKRLRKPAAVRERLHRAGARPAGSRRPGGRADGPASPYRSAAARRPGVLPGAPACRGRPGGPAGRRLSGAAA